MPMREVPRIPEAPILIVFADAAFCKFEKQLMILVSTRHIKNPEPVISRDTSLDELGDCAVLRFDRVNMPVVSPHFQR